MRSKPLIQRLIACALDCDREAVQFAPKGASPEFVQLILERVDLPLDLLEGRAFWGDEQAAIFATEGA